MDAGAYNDKGLACAGKGDYECALANYQQAIQTEADWAEPYDNRGLAYAAKGDYANAPSPIGIRLFNCNPIWPMPISIAGWLTISKMITRARWLITIRSSACNPTTTRPFTCAAALIPIRVTTCGHRRFQHGAASLAR